jgi:TonB family protein
MARPLDSAKTVCEMHKRHHNLSILVVSLFCLSFLLIRPTLSVYAQPPPPSQVTARGIQLYKQGDASGAIKLLKEVVKKQPNDAYAWYYLGLAFYGQGSIAQARPGFQRVIELWPDSADAHAKLAYALILANEPEKAMALAQRAIELGDQSPEAHYAIAEAILKSPANTLRPGQLALAVDEAETALRINPNFAPALITKSFALFNLKRYSEAATSLEGWLGTRSDDIDAGIWREQLEYLRAKAESRTTSPPGSEPPVFSGAMVTQKAQILSKPEPSYTEAARMAGVVGTVVLRGVLASDGEVKNLVVIQNLGYGLTTRAVQAARQIKFVPALKDNKPVSMYIQIEYNFNLF